eukprot:186214_1
MHGTSKSIPNSLLTDDALAAGNPPSSTVTDLEAIRPQTFDHDTNYFTVDEAISHIGTGKFQWRLLFLTGAIWSADAMEMMLLSFVMPILQAEWFHPHKLHDPLIISRIAAACLLLSI